MVRRFYASRSQSCSTAAMPPTGAKPEWSATWFDFALFAWCVIAGGFLAQIAAIQALSYTAMAASLKQVIAGAFFQLGMLGGIAGFVLRYPAGKNFPKPLLIKALSDGFQTFALALPLVLLSGTAWTWLLEIVGFPIQRQELVDIFADTTNPLQLGFMILFAVAIAPFTEELIFRAGIFRFLRTRIPRIPSLLLPAILFALLHANLASFMQLMVLGVVFSLSYERTNNIGVSMVAHAFFNLNTIALLLTGLEA